MTNLNVIDYSIIAAYFAILLAIGFWLRRKAASSMEAYFVGGRNIPWWALGMASTAAWLDMTGTMVITSFLFMLGPRGLFIEFRGGALLLIAVLMLWCGKWHRRSGAITGAEWIAFRFGKDIWGNVARIMSAVAYIALTVGLLCYSFKGAGLFLSMFIPLSPAACSVMLLVVTAIYTVEGGFYGVIVTDIFQTVCIVVGVVFVILLAVGKTMGTDLSAVAQAVTGNTSWVSSSPSWHTEMPKGYENYSFLMIISAFYLFKTLVQGAGMGNDPKYFAARNDRECGLLSHICGWMMMMRWPLMLGFAILGLFLVHEKFPDTSVFDKSAALIRQEFPDVTQAQWADRIAEVTNHSAKHPELAANLQTTLGDDWRAKLSLVGFQGTVDPERILPAVLLFNVPMGLRGLLLVALLAAAMSTFNSLINTATGYFTRDIMQAYVIPRASNKQLMLFNYMFGIVLVAVGFVLTYTVDNINDIWGWLMMGMTGGMAVPTLLRLYWWRFNGGGYAIGTFVGVAAAVAQRVWFRDMLEWQQFAYTMVLGLIGSVIGSYLTRPADPAVVENFYKKTRPFGLWGPLKKTLAPDVREAMEKEHFWDIAALPFALLWLVTIMLMPMQAMVGNWTALWITLPMFAVALAGLYHTWYKRLPPRDAG